MNWDFQSFHTLCPEEAQTETRGIINFNNSIFPNGQYFLLESYCNDKECDCKRVIINIVSAQKQKIIATIGYGWEEIEFYEKWAGDSEIAVSVKGPVLELGGEQSKYAKAFLGFFKNNLLKDPVFIERLKKHYKLFKSRL